MQYDVENHQIKHGIKKALVTGATGFIGKRLLAALAKKDIQCVAVSRNVKSAQETLGSLANVYAWSPQSGKLPSEALSDIDAVVSLAGEPVAGRRWTASQKEKILTSRVSGTRSLVEGIVASAIKPKVFVSASAIGIYGDRKDENLNEDSVDGNDFLAHVCKQWEAEAKKITDVSQATRSVIVRIGIVLGQDGGALEKLLPIFKAGIGGRLGSGDQWMSWIHVDDLVSILVEAVCNPKFQGVLNGVAPNPVTNKEFTRTLSNVVHRPAFLPVPAVALRAVVGEASTAILASQKVFPKKAEALGFKFRYPMLREALNQICLK